MTKLILLALAYLGFTLVSISPTPVSAESTSGWDYNLTKRCAKTPGPLSANYYEDATQCLDSKHWSLVVQAEKDLGDSCAGPNNQSYLINGPNSPVSMTWSAHPSSIGQNWTVNQKVDTTSGTTCENQYTFFGFFDDIEHGGGPLPNFLKLQSSHTIAYQQFSPGSGGARLTLGAQIFWNNKPHILEILPARIGYPKNAFLDQGIIQITTNNNLEYVIIDDSWGVKVIPDGTSQFVYVDWGSLFSRLIQKGAFTSPGSNETATQAVYVAVETYQQAIANVWQTDLRVSEK